MRARLNGLRIDHIDGLADPLGYQKQLVGEDVYIVAEKILEVRRRATRRMADPRHYGL